MKIYFCDGCNESIPLQDIKESMAVTLKGKIYCKNCNPLKDIQTHAPGVTTSTLTLSLMVLIVALLSVVIIMMILNQQEPEVKYATVDDLAQLRQDFHDQQEGIALITRQVAGLTEDFSGNDSRFSKVESDLVVLSGDLLGIRSVTQNISENFKALTNAGDKMDMILLKQEELADSLQAQARSLQTIKEQVIDLDKRQTAMAGLVASGALVQAKETSVPTESIPGESPLLQQVKSKLTSRDAGERFEAVYQVLDERIKEALPHVLPLIEDPDQFVQVGAIQTVGEFLFQEALPYLVRVLRDPDVTVRDESLRQLIRMTGQNGLEFDVRGSDSERDKAIRKWEKWVKGNS